MIGQELRTARERAGATRQRLAEIAGVDVREVEDWEMFGTIPPRLRRRVRLALWEIERDAALERSGLPPCEWIERLGRAPRRPGADRVIAHLESCATCRARADYLAEHVSPQPIEGGFAARLMGLLGRFSGWRRSALGGALIALLMGGWGVPLMLLLGVLQGNPILIVHAAALFVLLTASGAAGGIVHYRTRALRASGTAGHYASWILTVYGYFAAGLTLTLSAGAVSGAQVLSPEDLEVLSDPVAPFVLLALGAFFGLIAGRMTRDGGRAIALPGARRILSFRNVAVVAAVLLVVIARAAVRPTGTPAPAVTEQALPALRAAADQNPDDPAALSQLASGLVSLGRWAEAGPLLEQALPLNPGDSGLHWNLGRFRRYEGNHELAVPLFQRAAELAPDDTNPRNDLGWTFYDLGQLDAAEAEFRAAIRIEPRFDAPYLGLGLTLNELDRPEEAEAVLRSAIRLSPSNPRHHRALAAILEQQEKFAEALAAYDDAARLAPEDPGTWGAIGRLANEMEQYKRSIAAFERLKKLDPDSDREGTLWGEILRASRRGERY